MRIKPSRYKVLPHGFCDGVGSIARPKLGLRLFYMTAFTETECLGNVMGPTTR